MLMTACSTAPLYESVSVRVGQITCTERIYIDRSGVIGGSYVDEGSDGVTSTVDLALNLANVGSQEATQDKRCQDTLVIAEDMAAIELERASIKLEQEAIDLEMARMRSQRDMENLDAEYEDLASKW